MSESFINFVRHGRVGQLQVGDKRDDVRAKLGLPQKWLGKPVEVPPNWSGNEMDRPCSFGPLVHSPEDADVWYYYNAAAAIHFESSGVSDVIYVAPSVMRDKPADILRGQYPFEDWPLSDYPTMGEVAEALGSANIRFREPEDKSEDDFILVEDLCLIECWPYNEGKRPDFNSRYISVIWRYLTRKGIPEYIPSS